MKSSKHVLLLTPGFPENEDDFYCIPPVQIFLKNLLQAKSEIKISVIAFQYPYKKQPYEWHEIKVYPCGGAGRKFPGKFFTWKRVIDFFNTIDRQNKVGIVHSLWLNECALAGNYIGKKKLIPHIVTLMGQDATYDNRYLKLIDLNYPKLIALSEFQQSIFEHTTGKKVVQIIPWGIDLRDFYEPKNGKREIDVLGVGALSPLKNYAFFIEAIKKVKEKLPSVKCVIIGEGSERKELERKTKSLGLSENINFTGLLPRKIVLEHMANSKILLHPSNYESQGFVFNEALYSGMSIISKPVGIATPSEKWRIAETKDEMFSAIIELISTSSDYSPVLLKESGSTLNDYLQLYQI